MVSRSDGVTEKAIYENAVLVAPGEQFIVMASATGVPHGFYKRFAEFAHARGVNVVTTDYRGIGDSKPATLKGFDMQYADWSTLDLACGH